MAGPIFPKLIGQGNKTASVYSCYTVWTWMRSELNRVGRTSLQTFLANRVTGRTSGRGLNSKEHDAAGEVGSRLMGTQAQGAAWLCCKNRVHDPPLPDLTNSPSRIRTLVCFPNCSNYARPLLSLCPCLEYPQPSHLSIRVLYIFQDRLTVPSLQSFLWLFILVHSNPLYGIRKILLQAGLFFWQWYVLKNTYATVHFSSW